MRRTHAAFAVAAAAILTIAAGAAQDASVRITVLFTSDLHGHILPYDYFSAQPAEFGLAKVGTLIRRVREENPTRFCWTAAILSRVRRCSSILNACRRVCPTR